MKRPDLVFVTQDNEAKIKAALARGEAARCQACESIVGGIHDCPGRPQLILETTSTDDSIA